MSTEKKKSLLQETDDEARLHAKTMIRTARAGALALVDAESGRPLASRVGLATDIDGAPIFLMSDLSGRSKAIAADPRASLLVGDVGKGDPLAQPRMTLIGRVKRIDDETERARARRRYLARQPKAKLYVDFKDFAFWRFEFEGANLALGFGKAYRLSADDIKTNLQGFEGFLAMEEGAVAHMNEDHADAVRLYAEKLCKASEGAWRLAGLDPEGLDLVCGDDVRRLTFQTPLTQPHEIRPLLVALAKNARASVSA